MLSISSLAELDTWLAERGYFEDGCLAEVAQSIDGAVTLTLEQHVRSGYRPGDVYLAEVYELRVATPIEFEVPGPIVPDEIVEGVDTDDDSGLLVIEIVMAPGRLRLVAQEVTLVHTATEHRRTQPWVTDELRVATTAAHDDRYWAARVGDVLGTSVVWRVLGSPQPRKAGLDADGCFLQTPGRLATTDYGVFYTRSADGASATLTRYVNEDVDAALWQAVRRAAADFEQIRCGNCVFHSSDWLAFLATGEFPPDERLRGTVTI